MIGRGREDVDDAAAHRELSSARDHVDPRVGEFGQPLREALDLAVVTDGQLHRFDVPEAFGQRLEEGAHRRDDECQFPARNGMCQAAEDLKALAHRVRPRGQLLVRQGLPAGEDRDRRLRNPVGQGRGKVLGLSRGRGDDELRRRGGLPFDTG